MKKILTSNVFYILAITVFIVIQLYFSVLYRSISIGVEDINREFSRLTLQNQELTAKITSYTSLSEIERRAKKMGFIPAPDVIYLTSENKLAQKPWVKFVQKLFTLFFAYTF